MLDDRSLRTLEEQLVDNPATIDKALHDGHREIRTGVDLVSRMAACGLLISYGQPAIVFNPEPQVLKLRMLSGLEARHIVSRWREPNGT